MKKQRRRRWFFWGLTALITLALAIGVIGWMMFQSIPAWYQPVSVTGKQELQKIRDDLLGTLDTFGTALVHHQRKFQYKLNQRQLNDWLSARRQIWPGSRHWLPPQLTDPFIALSPDGVRVGVTYRNGEVKTVLNAHLAVKATRDGILVHLKNVQAGRVDIPRDWLREKLTSMAGNRWPAGEKAPFQYGPRPLPPLGDLFEGALFPSRWIWENGEQPFQIVDIQYRQGAVIVTVEPLGETHSDSRPKTQSTSPPRQFDWDGFLK
jgi:hypothetical protein